MGEIGGCSPLPVSLPPGRYTSPRDGSVGAPSPTAVLGSSSCARWPVLARWPFSRVWFESLLTMCLGHDQMITPPLAG